MKKIIITLCLVAGVLSAEMSDIAAGLFIAKAQGDKEAVLAFLQQAADDNETNMVYMAAFEITPKEDRASYAAEITNKLSVTSILRIRIAITPKGPECNELLKQLYSTDMLLMGPWKKFQNSCETKESAIAFYESVIKNVHPAQENIVGISDVYNQLAQLKLKP